MSQLKEFIDALKDEDYFKQEGRRLALIEPGNWEGIVRWGKECGYQFTLKDLVDYGMKHKHIFNKIPTESRLRDWNLATLRSAIKGEL